MKKNYFLLKNILLALLSLGFVLNDGFARGNISTDIKNFTNSTNSNVEGNLNTERAAPSQKPTGGCILSTSEQPTTYCSNGLSFDNANPNDCYTENVPVTICTGSCNPNDGTPNCQPCYGPPNCSCCTFQTYSNAASFWITTGTLFVTLTLSAFCIVAAATAAVVARSCHKANEKIRNAPSRQPHLELGPFYPDQTSPASVVVVGI